MKRHTIVLSDVHLSQTQPEDPKDPLWMLYRAERFHPDRDFAALVDRLLEETEGDALELVFNGDVLDFDAPWVKDGEASFDEFPLTDEGCAAQARRIVRDHRVWFDAVRKVLRKGHKVLFLSGNHDLELYFPSVREVLREELGATDDQVRFRTWFHVTEDKIYLEHGSQYDIHNGVRWPMLPLTRDRKTLHPVMGKQAFKRTGSRMGYFNPYYEETFYMGLFGYLRHFAKFYLRSHRNIIRTWAKGSWRTAAEIWRERHDEDWAEENAELAARETGAPIEAVRKTQALRATPAEVTMLPLLRELWLDRVAIALFVVVAGSFAALFGVKPAAFTLGVLIVAFVLYEVLTPKPDIRTYDSAPPSVRALWDIHGARAICMGHTHRPFAIWEDGKLFANSGSWCPAFKDQLCKEPVLAKRPFLWLTSEGDELRGGLFWWKDGALERAKD